MTRRGREFGKMCADEMMNNYVGETTVRVVNEECGKGARKVVQIRMTPHGPRGGNEFLCAAQMKEKKNQAHSSLDTHTLTPITLASNIRSIMAKWNGH